MNAPALPKRYSIASLLGEGGQGRVYRVRDVLRDHDLALKLVSAADAEFLRREFDTLRQVRHENLIQVFDWGSLDSGEAFYTMELVEGEDWGRRMGAPQPADDVRRILTAVLRGLAHLHCHGEIHGDLKPGNILLGSGGVVKVTDIGMGGSKGSGGVAGTPGYTAPECWQGRAADVRSDLYSVGVLAYEALTGKHPFGGRTIREVVAGQMEGWVPSPAAHRVTVPADLERVVMRALEREAPLRQGSADEFMEGFGVEDRIGVILGGRFVDPAGLLPQIVRRVHRSKPDDPTLLTLIGAPGSGKSEWLEQLNQTFVSEGVRCMQLMAGSRAAFGEALSSEIHPHDRADSNPPASPKDLVAGIRSVAGHRPLAILLDAGEGHSQSFVNDARAFAQHLFADASENRDVLESLVIVADVHEPEASVFSVPIPIPDLDEAGSTSLAVGLLGAVDMPPEGARALHRATGGNPAAVQAVLFDLIARGELERIEGRWKIAEIGRIGEGSISTLDQRWRRRWQQLQSEQQRVLGAVALIGSLVPGDVGRLERRIASEGTVAALRAGGWLKLIGHRLRVASAGLEELVAGLMDNEEGRALSGELLGLHLGDEGLSNVMLRLRALPSREALSEALQMATALIEKREFSRASALVRECRRHDSLLQGSDAATDLLLKSIEVSIGMGDLEQAQAALDASALKEASTRSAGVRAKMHWYRGTLASRAGRTEEAGQALETAIAAAQEAGDITTRVRSVVAYAELAWMHGNDQDCASAIEIAERTLSDMPRSGEYQEERGQLVYAIGASLIRTGRLEKATTLFDTELPSITSPYWSARVANAKGGAHFYLGQYDRALRFLTLAIERLPDGDAPELRARIHANRGACLNAMGSIRRALDDNERALALSRRSGSGYDTVAAAAGIGIDLFYLGRYDETVRSAREVHELASRLNNIIYQFKGLELEGFAAHAIGDFTALERILIAADKLPKDHDPARTLPRIERLRARLLIERGQLDLAAAALRRAIMLLEGESDLEDLWGIEIELAVLNHVEAGDFATLAALAAIAARAREAKNIVVEVDAVAALAQIVTASGRSDAELIRAMTLTLGRAEESGFVDQAARISVGLGGALIDSGDVRAGQSRLVQAQRLLRQIASELSPESRECFVRSPHVASALREIERRLKPLPR